MLFIQEESVCHIWKMVSCGSPGAFKHVLEKKKRKKSYLAILKFNQKMTTNLAKKAFFVH